MRNYTNTLISDSSQLGSGPIMGSKALDFLRRQDKSPAPQKRKLTATLCIDTIQPNSSKPRLPRNPRNAPK